MSTPHDQTGARIFRGINLRDGATWVRLCMVTLHLCLIVSGPMILAGLLATQILPYQSLTQHMIAVAVAFLLWFSSGLCTLTISFVADSYGYNVYLKALGKGTGWPFIIFFLWSVFFLTLNIIIIDAFWRLFSVEFSYFFFVAPIYFTAIGSFPYVLTILRGSSAETMNVDRPTRQVATGEPQS